MKKLVLLINGNLGIEVLNFITSQKEIELIGVIINSANKRSSGYFSRVTTLLLESNQDVPIISYEDVDDNYIRVVEILNNSDYGISALFGHILPRTVIENIDCEIINLHPSLLPIGRGADPIPWSIINQQKQGVTIHIIDSGLDTGGILCQKEFSTNIGMNSGKVYELAAGLLFNELERIFHSWTNNTIRVSNQSEFFGSTHKSKELEDMRIINADEVGTFGEFLRKLQALTFSDGRKPSFIDESGRVWSIDISITLQRDEE